MYTTILRIHLERKNCAEVIKQPTVVDTNFTLCDTEGTTSGLKAAQNIMLKVAKELDNMIKGEEVSADDTSVKSICV